MKDGVKLKSIIVVAVLLLLRTSMLIYSSISQWELQPKKIMCSSLTNTCTLKEYAYKHEICWGERTRRVKSCSLPKYETAQKELFPLTEIKDVVVKEEQGKYEVCLKNIKDKEECIAVYDKYTDATDVSSDLRVHIKKLQEEQPLSSIEPGETFSYDI